MKKAAAPRAPPRPIQSRAQTSATAGGDGEQHRLEHEAELRHAEVELGLEGRQADQQAAHQADAAQPRRSGRARRAGGSRRTPGARARIPSTSSTAWPIRVMPAPPISIRWVGPQRVTSWPNRRCQTSSSGKPIRAKAPQAAIRTPPTGAYQSPSDPDGGRPGALLRQADREEAGGEDAEEAGEDQVVGGVGERARVAAGVDVERDVPVHAEQRDQERGGGERRGQRGPAGQAGDSLGEVGGAAEVGDPAAAVAHPEPGDRGAQRPGRRRWRSPPGRGRRRRRAPRWRGGRGGEDRRRLRSWLRLALTHARVNVTSFDGTSEDVRCVV